jgi:Carboxypeptidase regulatory-like domain
MRKITLLVSALALLLAAFTCTLSAQQITATISGTVSDATGAAVPGADVKATNTQTQVSMTTTSGPDGSFQFLNLPVGRYDVTVSKSGFRTSTTHGIVLALNQTYTVPVTLEVGQVSESVQVEANPVQVETSTTQLDTVVQSQQIVDMPLNGRNWTQLQQLAPGVVSSSDRFGTYSTNGSQSQQNSFLINGADAIDLPLNTPLIIPSPDAISQFNLLTSTIDPQYGRNSGGILNAIIKSGTNAYHGDAFEFFRDTSLNSRNFFQVAPPVFHQNQFGGTFGGPIIKDHTFFFLSYQGTRARTSVAENTPVFTQDQRDGIFPDIASSSDTSATPLIGEDGLTYPAGTPYSTIFPTGHIPSVDFNPISVNLMNKYVPLPNLGTNYSFNDLTISSQDQGIARVDSTWSKDTIWWTGFFQKSPSTDTLPFAGGNLPGFGDASGRSYTVLQADWTHTLSPTTLNEFRASWLRFNFDAVEPQSVVQPSSLGFTGINPNNAVSAGVPAISLSGFFTLGFSEDGPQPRIDSTYELADNFSKILGSHTLKFGWDGKRYNVVNPFNYLNNGYYSFGGNGVYSTGDAGADFLLGIPDSYYQDSGGEIYAQSYEQYFYVQDSWKMRKNFTMNYGLGWTIDTPVVNSAFGGLDFNCFRPGQQSTVFPTAPVGLVFPGDTGCSASGYYTHYDHFEPRFGFAWTPNLGFLSGETHDKFVVRGGFGVYDDRTEEELTLQNLTSYPFSVGSAGIGDLGGNPTFANPWVDIGTGQTLGNKFPFAPPAAGSNVDFSFFEPFSFNTINPDFTSPYSMNFNLNIQRELPGSMILQIGYVGELGRHEEMAYEGNPIWPSFAATCAQSSSCIANRAYEQYFNPTATEWAPGDIFASVGTQNTVGVSSYNSLQASLNKRFSHGLQFQISYTYSHAIDDGSSFENSSFGTQGTNPYNFAMDRGDSAYDARHRFVAEYDYELPGISKLMGGSHVLHTLIDGWTITGITTLQTGFPITTADSRYPSLTCGYGFTYYGCPDRPDYNGQPLNISDPRDNSISFTSAGTVRASAPNYWFNPNAFTHAAYGTFGNEQRDNFHGPGINNTDLGLFKRFHFGESETRMLELRLEAFNLFNHTQFSSPSSNLNSSLFGRITGAGAGRIAQIAAKIYF